MKKAKISIQSNATIVSNFRKKSKSDYFGNLNEKNINDYKTFWKTIKPFLPAKVRLANKMALIDNEEIIIGGHNTAKVLNTFFSNIASNLNIAEYSNCEPLANNISDTILKCVVIYRNHRSILAIGEVCKKLPRRPSSFSKKKKKNREEILGEMLKLETSRACQDTDILTKIIKENAAIFADILVARFNDSVEKSNLPSSLKKGKYNTCI